MPDETKDTAVVETPETLNPTSFLKSMEGMFERFMGGMDAKAAATARIEVKDNQIASKATATEEEEDKSESHQDRVTKFVDPLRKSFEALATINPAYRRLGTNAALDDPYGFLSQKGADGRHIISAGQLDAMAQYLLASKMMKDEAMSMGDWLVKGQGGHLIQHKMEQGLIAGAFGQLTGAVSKALDTSLAGGIGGGALIRTDLEPILYEAYLRRFPGAAAIRTFPANGLVHTYDIRSAVGNAAPVGELGDIVTQGADATSTIERKANSNIAILCSRRGVSLKLQFAVAQSGMNFPLAGNDNLEIVGGVTSIADLNQTLLFQGNFSQGTGTLNNEDGLFNALGYDGLRQILKAAGTSKTFVTGEQHRENIDKLVAQIDDDGGNINDLVIFLRHGARIAVQGELNDFMRILGDRSAQTGVPQNTLMGGFLLFGARPAQFLPVPGQTQAKGIGFYDIAAVAFEDVYISDPTGVGFAYLGSPSPVVLELPIGFDNKLGNVYILFMMNGLVVTIPKFH